MKIKDIAEKYSISMQAIYQRLKKKGIAVESLKDPETGELTPDALGIFENLFGESSALFNQQHASKNEEIARLNALVQSLEHEKELLEVKLASAERERDRLEETLNQERMLFVKYLPDPEANKKSLFRRIFGR